MFFPEIVGFFPEMFGYLHFMAECATILCVMNHDDDITDERSGLMSN